MAQTTSTFLQPHSDLVGQPTPGLVEQNACMALTVSHHGYVLQTGQIVLTGTAKDLQTNETVRKAYLGEA